MELQGRTALVTGFAGAIGSVIATSLANAGCDVIGVDKAVAVECADKGVTCNAICPTVVDTPCKCITPFTVC
uniref:3-oxoacyl-[acyl-carrier-protein] reductase n=1 Tax=Magallana gigas TaxID=29159 RepID=K1PEW8_MAGGI